jgi:hypothetical protein
MFTKLIGSKLTIGSALNFHVTHELAGNSNNLSEEKLQSPTTRANQMASTTKRLILPNTLMGNVLPQSNLGHLFGIGLSG